MRADNMFHSPSKALAILFCAMLFPVLLGAQSKKSSSPAPAPKASAPAPHAAAPAKPAGSAARPGPTTGGRPGTTTAPRPGTPGAKPGARPGTPGAKPGTLGAKPGTLGAKPGTPGAKPGTPGAKPGTTNTAGGKPAAPGTVNRPGGGKTVTTAAGHSLEYNKSGKLSKVTTRGGSEAHFDSRGKVSTIRTAHGTVITHGPGGSRRMVSERRGPNGRVESRLVNTGPHRGYAEHGFRRGGRDYNRRTYYYGGRAHVYVYRSYYYHGGYYPHYVPAYYYGPAYYGWAYNPWAVPVAYNWGWGGAGWYAPYGYYFAPYPVYPSAAFWLTDYLIAENLRAGYEAQAAAASGGASSQGDGGDAQASQAPPQAGEGAQPAQNTTVTLTPEVKQMIADEVKAQLAAEKAEAAQADTASAAPPAAAPEDSAPPAEQLPSALDANLKVFIVATSFDVSTNDQTCALTAGDVLMRSEDTPDKDNSVAVNVVSSKKTDCAIGSSQRVQVADLQEMHNHFREQLGNGLKTLAENQGKNGIPSGPPLGEKANREGTAAPDLTVASDLDKQQQEGDTAEQEVQQAAATTPAAGGQY